MGDQNFDSLTERFDRRLYGKPKGQLRLQLVSEALLEDCPAISTDTNKKLRVLDLGCGLGQVTELLASHGHSVIACDISERMLEQARARILSDTPACLANIQFEHCSLQTLAEKVDGQFDLIIFHAVLEWLDEPRAGLAALLPWLREDGELSLLFYNLHALLFRNLLRGDFRRMELEKVEGEAGSLTPKNPLKPEDVEQWLAELGLTITSKRGIRTFFDFMEQANTPQRLQKISLQDVVAMERRLGKQEPYLGLARYQMRHCRKTSIGHA